MIQYKKDGVVISDGAPIRTATGRFIISPSPEQYAENGYTAEEVLPLKKEWIQEKIHERYSLDDEIALINNHTTEPAEYEEYQQFRASVKAQADQLVAEGKLKEA